MSTSSPSLDISLATPAERRNVLRRCLVRRHQTPVDLERQVGAFLQYAAALSMDLNHLWICRSGAKELAACACICSPGRTAMLLLPSGLVQPVDDRALHAMIDRIAGALQASGVELIQALLEQDDDAQRRALLNEKFEEIALLRYLECPLDRTPIPLVVPEDLPINAFHWLDYSEANHAAFVHAVRESYIGSLDCPRLSRLRDVQDVLEGHKSAGLFRPTLWRLLMKGDEPAGCALLAQHPLRPMVEVVYMGILPNFRNHRLGNYLLGAVLRDAQQDGFQSATLAVDSANVPGRKLYSHFGFSESTTRRALIRHPRLRNRDSG